MGDEFEKANYVFINRSLKKRDTSQFVDDFVKSCVSPAIAQVIDVFKYLGF